VDENCSDHQVKIIRVTAGAVSKKATTARDVSRGY
jgi:hypothetical protein